MEKKAKPFLRFGLARMYGAGVPVDKYVTLVAAVAIPVGTVFVQKRNQAPKHFFKTLLVLIYHYSVSYY